MPSASVSSTKGRIAFQAASSHGTMSETTSARSGQFFFTLLDLAQVQIKIAVGDELDVVQAEKPAVSPPDRAIARPIGH